MNPVLEEHPAVLVIDVGSNTIKALAIRQDAPDAPCFNETVEVRISAGMSYDPPRLDEAALLRGADAVAELLARGHEAAKTKLAVRIVGTSALRDATNREAFLSAVRERTGFTVRILSGTEEATAIARGASRDPNLRNLGSFALLDLGGGSLEVIGYDHGQLLFAESFNLGAVRLLRRFVSDPSAPLDPREAAAAAAHVAEELAERGTPERIRALPHLVGTGGSFTISRAILASRRGGDGSASSPVLERRALDALAAELGALSLEERLRIPGLPASRADILPIALRIVLAASAESPAPAFHHSFYNLRWGIAAEWLAPSAKPER